MTAAEGLACVPVSAFCVPDAASAVLSAVPVLLVVVALGSGRPIEDSMSWTLCGGPVGAVFVVVVVILSILLRILLFPKTPNSKLED